MAIFGFNVSKARKRLDGVCVLIADSQDAKIISIKEKSINTRILLTPEKAWTDQAGYFKGTSGGGISDELNIKKEEKKQFYKQVLEEGEKHLKKEECERFAIMCLEEDISLIKGLLSSEQKNRLIGIKRGNYTKANINEILKNVLKLL